MPTLDLVPEGERIYLDHLGLFVGDFDASPARLEQLGFTLTPFVAHRSSDSAGGKTALSGTGNQCAMFRAGYLEMLGPTVATPLARQLRQRLQLYPGLHLIATAVNDAAAHYQRVIGEGFEPQPLVSLERAVEQADGGEQTARFTVVRTMMGEGRAQIVTHHTPHLIWQPRYLQHANGAEGLAGAVICCDDIDETAARFARYFAAPASVSEGWREIHFDRGTIRFIAAAHWPAYRPATPLPSTPYVAEMILHSADLAITEACLRRNGIRYERLAGGGFYLAPAAALGAGIVFIGGRQTFAELSPSDLSLS